MVTLTPNRARMVWDVAATLMAIVVGQALLSLGFDRPILWPVAVAVPLVPGLIALSGLYTRYGAASWTLKLGVLAACLAVTSCALLLLGVNAADTLFIDALLYPLLALPRVFLNLRVGSHSAGVVKRIISEKGPILVVGGAGYIGSHVVEQLLSKGRRVRVLDRLMYGRDSLKTFLPNSDFEFVEGDATDIQKLTEAVNGVSAVVHLAGLVGDPACAVDSEFTRHTNIIATRMVKEVSKSFGVSRLVFASSCSVYGVNPDEVNETTEPRPVSLYAQTKLDSEQEILSTISPDLCSTVLRFATVFGHSQRPRFDLVANLFAAQAMIDGRITVIGPGQWRPFVHVRDLARAIVMVLEAPTWKVSGEVFNVGDRRLNLTIGDLGEAVRKIVARDRVVELTIDDKATDLRNYAVAFDKIRTALGFECETLLEAGVSEIIDHFKLGTYDDFRNERYSNLAVTRRAVVDFRDPLQIMNLYRPIVEDPRFRVATKSA